MILVEYIMGFICLMGVKLDTSVNIFNGVMMKSASTVGANSKAKATDFNP